MTSDCKNAASAQVHNAIHIGFQEMPGVFGWRNLRVFVNSGAGDNFVTF
jgi:hypothetical protein